MKKSGIMRTFLNRQKLVSIRLFQTAKKKLSSSVV